MQRAAPPPPPHSLARSLTQSLILTLHSLPLAEYFHFSLGSFASLAVIVGLLAAGTLASLLHNRSAAGAGRGLGAL